MIKSSAKLHKEINDKIKQINQAALLQAERLDKLNAKNDSLQKIEAIERTIKKANTAVKVVASAIILAVCTASYFLLKDVQLILKALQNLPK